MKRLIVLLIAAIGCVPDQPPATQTRVQKQVPAETTVTIHFFGSPTKEGLDRCSRMVGDGDEAAFNQTILSGEAVPLKVGTTVYTEEVDGTYVRIRPKGSTRSLWVYRATLKGAL